MKRRCLLHLDHDGLSAWTGRRGALRELAHFPDDAVGHAEFAGFLAKHRRERFALLVDQAEETLQPIEIPRLGRRDRATLIARRLARHFPDTPLRCAEPLGRDPAAPGSEKLLLLALGAPWRLAPWLTLLAQAGSELGRLHTASQLAGPLLARLGTDAPSVLLVVCHRRSFRITGLAAGHPRFSRLVANGDDSPAAAIANEAGRLHRYLLDQRLHPHGRALPVVVIAGATLLAELAGQWPGTGELTLLPLEFAAAAGRIGLAAPVEEADSRAIQVQLLANCPSIKGIRLGGGPSQPPTARIGRLLIAAGGAALCGALIFATWQLRAAKQASHEAQRLDDQRFGLHAQSAIARWEPPALPLDAASLRRASEIRAKIARLQQLPEPAYLRVSRALDRLPAIAIERIDWKILPPSGSTAELPLPPIESTTLYGHLGTMPADFAAFLEALRTDPSIELLIRQAPAEDPFPEFVVELKRSLPP